MPISPEKIKSPNILRLAPLLLMLLVALLLASGLFNKSEFESDKSLVIGYNVGKFSIPTLDGAGRLSPETWQNKIVVINIFASWCQMCIIEHPVLMKLANAGIVEIIGIAWKDKPDDAWAWLKKYGNPYHHIGVDTEGDTTMAFAITGVPETYIIDRNGKIAFNHKAVLNDEVMNTVVIPMIEHLRNANAPLADSN